MLEGETGGSNNENSTSKPKDDKSPDAVPAGAQDK